MLGIQEKTPEEKARDAALDIKSHAVSSVGSAIINYNDAFGKLWNVPGVTAQEICDQYGNQAHALFETAGVWIGCIQALDPSWTPPPAPNEFTINPDGTVTIGDPIEATPE